MRWTARWLAGLLLAGCAAPRPRPSTSSPPRLVVDSPRPHELVRTTEVDVRGHFVTADGRAWVYADATPATVVGNAFVASRVPLREGAMEVAVDLTDGAGRKARLHVPIVVESADRPRSAQLCKASLGCLRYEERGLPTRDAEGRVTNAVVVISAFGFDERLDELWPDLVGPGRALDTRRYYIVGVAGAPDAEGHRPEPAALVELLSQLLHERALARTSALVGASSYGAELALRVLASGGTSGPVLIVGGHDRPRLEPAMQRVQQVLEGARAAHRSATQTWLDVSRAMVPVSYTPAYLADPSRATEHGIDAAEVARVGLTEALTTRQAAHFEHDLPVGELERRMAAAFALGGEGLAYPRLDGRRVVIVGNRDDRMMTLANLRDLGSRLGARGADVQLVELADPLGHSVFFRRSPPELERAVTSLLAAMAPR